MTQFHKNNGAVVAMAVLLFIVGSRTNGEGLTRVERDASLGPSQAIRERAIMEAADFEKWPQNARLTLAPIIDRNLLPDPKTISSESRSHDVILLEKTPTGTLDLEWRSLMNPNGPYPTELPEEMRLAREQSYRERFPNASPPELKADLEAALAQYIKAKATELKGHLRLKIVAAPSSRAAQEWLIYESTATAMPTEMIAAEFAAQNRKKDLGDIAFKLALPTAATIRFVRGNIAVMLRADGIYAAEIDAIATRLDATIAKEAAITDLKDARPRLTTGALQHSAAANQKAIPVTVTLPAGQRTAAVHATINGQYAAVRNNELLLGSETGKLDIKIEAITDRLMAATASFQVNSDEK